MDLVLWARFDFMMWRLGLLFNMIFASISWIMFCVVCAHVLSFLCPEIGLCMFERKPYKSNDSVKGRDT